MRSIREYIRKTLFDSSSILSTYRLDAPQRVKDFAFVRARPCPAPCRMFQTGGHIAARLRPRLAELGVR